MREKRLSAVQNIDRLSAKHKMRMPMTRDWTPETLMEHFRQPPLLVSLSRCGIIGEGIVYNNVN